MAAPPGQFIALKGFNMFKEYFRDTTVHIVAKHQVLKIYELA